MDLKKVSVSRKNVFDFRDTCNDILYGDAVE